ncbi:MAG: D-alanyl-D-alanine carboxypeptidase/D-alanyl-D-alanine-endopeptidase [Nitrospinae bacterium]|nr:D-alanyl-D-alanine carboxypeptidase/D-alanyl-D-alanine-endopeptidase [Nitrospinota bacterium]
MDRTGTQMKLIVLTAVVLCQILFSGPRAAGAEENPVARFKKSADGILNHLCLRNGNYGVKIYSLDKKEVLYQVNAERPLVPASNMKLITSAVALKELGPDYRFITQLYSPGKIEGTTLKGDLYIKGFGDPKLVSEQMWQLVNGFRNLPVRKVEGNVIADNSFFDDELRIKTWKKNFGAQPYNAPIGALSFNFNTVAVYVNPGARPGEKPVVVVDPDTDYIRVKNGAVTVANNRNNHRLMVNRLEGDGFDEVTLSGGVPVNGARSRFYLNISDPTLYTVKVLKELLVRNGVEVTGEARKGATPNDAGLLLTHESESLSEILGGLNKYSNNFIAEQIVKTIGAERFDPPGTTANGIKAMEEFMQSLGYAPDQFRIMDGSGLSRQNRVSADQFVRVLEVVYNDWSVYPEFISALGVMGLDGSVKKRMKGVNDAQRARVKTGTLNFTSSVSGYFQSRQGERFAFSIVMNDLKCSIGQAMNLQDKIIHEGLKFERDDLDSLREARALR